jgi:hypothetical protein
VRYDIEITDEKLVALDERVFKIELFKYTDEPHIRCFRIRESEAEFTFKTLGGSSTEFCDRQNQGIDLLQLAEEHLRWTLIEQEKG